MSLSSRPDLLRPLVIALASAALLGVAAHVGQWISVLSQPWYTQDPRQAATFLLVLTTNATMAAIALVVALAARAHGPLLGALYLACTSLLQTIPRSPILEESVLYRLVYAALVALAFTGAIRFPQNFPKRLTAADLPRSRWRPLLAFLLRPAVVWSSAVIVSLMFALQISPWIATLLSAVAAFAFLRINYQHADVAERRRIYWLVQGVLISLVAIAIGSVLGWTVGAFAWTIAGLLGQLALSLCVGIALFYHGALDPRLVVKRTAALSAAAGMVVLMFITIETLVANLLIGRLASDSSAVQVGAGVMATLCARPIHKSIERFLQKHLPATETTLVA